MSSFSKEFYEKCRNTEDSSLFISKQNLNFCLEEKVFSEISLMRDDSIKIKKKNYLDTKDDILLESLADLKNNLDIFKTRNNFIIFKNLVNEKNEDDKTIIIADLSKLTKQHLKWITNLPTVMPFYAVKCNNDSEIIKTLNEFGCGFDCASKSEIKQIIDLGVSPSKIIYAHPIKTVSDLKYAFETGVDLMTFDSIEELKKIDIHHKNAKLVLRILVDDCNSVTKLGEKFGVPSDATKEIIEIIMRMNMKLVGVSFHVGSNCLNPDSFFKAIKRAREVFDESNELGLSLNLLDIGGGIPGIEYNENKFEDYFNLINSALIKYFSDLNVKVIAEPGRYYATSVMQLALNVIGRKTFWEDETKIDELNKEIEVTANKNLHENHELKRNKKFMYYLSDGSYGCLNRRINDDWEIKNLDQMNIIMWDNIKKKYVIQDKENFKKKKKFKSIIWGPSCDSTDFLAKNLEMPEIQIGDWIVFENFGDYSIVIRSEFNGIPRPEVYYLSNRTSENIQKIFYEFYNNHTNQTLEMKNI